MKIRTTVQRLAVAILAIAGPAVLLSGCLPHHRMILRHMQHKSGHAHHQQHKHHNHKPKPKKRTYAHPCCP